MEAARCIGAISPYDVTNLFMLQMENFREAAGLGFEPRLTDPESVFFRDTGGHGETGKDKTALLSISSSLKGTGSDRQRHPVAVRLRSESTALEEAGAVPRCSPP